MKNICSKIFKVLVCFTILGTINSYAVTSTNNYYNSTTYENAMENTKIVDNTKKVYDYAELLDEKEEEKLRSDINKFIEKYNMDMVIVTISKNNKSSSMAYADDFYDYNKFGIGSNKSGLLFLIDMDNRKMWISTTGDAINIYNDARIDSILDYTYKKISAKDYNGCAKEFIKYAEYFAKKGKNGGNNIISIQETATGAMGLATFATIAFMIIGLAMHAKPRKKTDARQYVSRPLKLSHEEDRFIDRHVSKTYRDTSSSSSGSGGSSTHTSSSGSSHGGGGRSF